MTEPVTPTPPTAGPSERAAAGCVSRRLRIAAALVVILILATLGLVRWLPDRGPAPAQPERLPPALPAPTLVLTPSRVMPPGVDPRPATQTQLDNPRGVAVDADGSLYIADANNDRVRRVEAAGTITTVAGVG